jgi:hypothetical protein
MAPLRKIRPDMCPKRSSQLNSSDEFCPDQTTTRNCPRIVEAFALIIWRQDIKRSTHWKFWHHLIGILVYNSKVFDHHMSICAQNKHFLEYRDIVCQEIATQLNVFANDSSVSQPKNAEKLTA